MSYHRFCTVKIQEGPKLEIFKLQGRKLKKKLQDEKPEIVYITTGKELLTQKQIT